MNKWMRISFSLSPIEGHRKALTGMAFAAILIAFTPHTLVHAGDYEDASVLIDRMQYGKAFPLIKNAAEQGNADAQFKLGRMYDFGQGTQRNQALAAEWYEKAALQGNVSAQANLGRMYQLGLGVRQDDGQAKKWYRMAADNGSRIARVKLSRMEKNDPSQEGKEVGDWPANTPGTAANSGDTFQATVLLAQGKHDEAFPLMKKAAEKGNASAQYNLGLMYARGQGIAQDRAQAEYWLRLAASQGNDRAGRALENMKRSQQQASGRGRFDPQHLYAPAEGAGGGLIVGKFHGDVKVKDRTDNIMLECPSATECRLKFGSAKGVHAKSVAPLIKFDFANTALECARKIDQSRVTDKDILALQAKLKPMLESGAKLETCWDMKDPTPTYTLACTVDAAPFRQENIYLFDANPWAGPGSCGYMIFPLSRQRE